MLRPHLMLRFASFGWLLAIMIGCASGDDTPIGPEAGPPADLEIISGDGQSGTVGQVLADQIAVRITDASGRRVSGVVVSFSTADPGGSFAPAATATDVQGVARTAWTLGRKSGLATATATVDGLMPETFSATALAGPAAQMVAVAGNGQSAEVGSAVAIAPTVEVLDTDGNLLVGVVVTFEPSGGGTVTPGSAVTGPDGRAAPERWTLGETAGEDTLRASSPAVPGVVLEFLATGTPGPLSASRSTMFASPAAGLTGGTGTIRVEAKDAFGNSVPGVAVRLGASGSGTTLNQPEAATDADGVATGSVRFDDVGSTTLSAELGAVPLEQTITIVVSYGEGTLTGLTYCTVDGVSSLMDVYVPDASKARPLPAAVHVHGGGWTGGSRSKGFSFPDVVRTLLDRGYLVVSVDYRLAPTYKYPAQIKDVKCAIRHLRANAARYGLDPDRIGAWGGSAGGQLVGLLGTADASAGFDDTGGFAGESSRVQAVIAQSAITDFTHPEELNDDYHREFLTWPDPESPEMIEASPVTHVSPDDSPFFFIVGDEDDLVLPAQSKRMNGLLLAQGIPSDLLVVLHADHALQPTSSPIDPSTAVIIERMADFFDRHLR